MRLQSEKWQEEWYRLEQLSDEDLIFCYIEVKSLYESQKRFFSLIMATILVAGFSNLWEALWKFAKNVFQVQSYMEDDVITFLSFVFVICLIFSLAIFVAILSYMSFMKKVHQKLLLIEHIKSRRGL